MGDPDSERNIGYEEGYETAKEELKARDAQLKDDLAWIISVTEWGTEIRAKAEHAWSLLV